MSKNLTKLLIVATLIGIGFIFMTGIFLNMKSQSSSKSKSTEISKKTPPKPEMITPTGPLKSLEQKEEKDCRSIDTRTNTYYDKEQWTFLEFEPAKLRFEYPIQKGTLTLRRIVLPDCDSGDEKNSESTENFYWEYGNDHEELYRGIEIAGAFTPGHVLGREGWYPDIRDLEKKDGKYYFKSQIKFFNREYLNPIKVFKTRYDTDAVLVNYYDFAYSIDDRVGQIAENHREDKLLFIKLPNNKSKYQALAIYLPEWVDNDTAKRIVDSITIEL